MHARVDSPVDSIVQSLGLATAQRHVGDGTLVFGLSGGGIFSLGIGELFGSLFSGPQNTANDVGHGTASVGTQNFDGNDVGSLGNTILARSDCTGTVGPVTVAILVDVIQRNGLAPVGATLELDVVNVDTGIHNVHIDTVTAVTVVFVEGESSQTKLITVGDTR